MTRLFFLVAIAFALGGTASANANTTVRSLALDILAGIDASPLDSLPANSGYGAPRITVSTVAANGDVTDDGNTFSRRLLNALKDNARGRYRFVATDALDDLIISIQNDGSSEDDRHARIRDLRANARADVLVTGTYRRRNGVTRLSYQAVNPETGELLASADAALAPHRPADERETRPNKSPDRRYRPTVEEAEAFLLDKGYDPGPVDGYMTQKTRRALRAYQADSALPVNGRLTRRTVKNLRRDTRQSTF